MTLSTLKHLKMMFWLGAGGFTTILNHRWVGSTTLRFGLCDRVIWFYLVWSCNSTSDPWFNQWTLELITLSVRWSVQFLIHWFKAILHRQPMKTLCGRRQLHRLTVDDEIEVKYKQWILNLIHSIQVNQIVHITSELAFVDSVPHVDLTILLIGSRYKLYYK